MREILFRGKVTGIPLYLQDKTKIGTWVYGYYVSYPVARIFDLEDEYIVDPATVGQYTVLCDKNGVKIFEGDIVADNEKKWTYTVKWNTVSWEFYDVNGWGIFDIASRLVFLEVIGNIHDNPELLKEESK